jgi:hypothetical protein
MTMERRPLQSKERTGDGRVVNDMEDKKVVKKVRGSAIQGWLFEVNKQDEIVETREA